MVQELMKKNKNNDSALEIVKKYNNKKCLSK
jgi:hypothetical protein